MPSPTGSCCTRVSPAVVRHATSPGRRPPWPEAGRRAPCPCGAAGRGRMLPSPGPPSGHVRRDQGALGTPLTTTQRARLVVAMGVLNLILATVALTAGFVGPSTPPGPVAAASATP